MDESGMTNDPIALRVRVQPRSSRNKITGWKDGVLTVRLTAPPIEGAANKSCVELLARELGMKRYEISLVSGEKSRDKVFEIEGLTQEALEEKLKGIKGLEENDRT